MAEPVLVTGGLGCIGAWVCRVLLQQGKKPVVFDLARDTRRLEAILTPAERDSVQIIAGDLTMADEVKAAVARSGATRLIHLAALQIPLVRANPSLGAAVNVVGTTNVFEAAKAAGISRVVFASSVAIYGPPDRYATEILPDDAEPLPADLYGAFKVDNELSAKVYWERDGITSIGLRLHTVYGPGRDQGITSEPTKAVLAACEGLPFHISYGGKCAFSYAEDVAETFVRATEIAFQGAESYGVQGHVVSVEDFVAALRAVLGGDVDVTTGSGPLPLPAGMEDTALQRLLGEVPNRSLEDGISATAVHHRRGRAS